MKNSFNLNSTEWCDIIFEEKNKSYGAFALRQSSGKRHLLAFGVIVLFVGFVTVLPMVLDTVRAATNTQIAGIDGEYKMKVIDVENKTEDPQTLIPEVPEPPKYLPMDKYVPPVIVPNSTDIPEEHQMKATDKVINSNKVVGGFQIDEGSTDPDAIIKTIENNNKIAGNGNTEGNTNTKKIFERVEIMPQFPGGEKEMYKYIADNLKYPMADLEAGTEGRVVLRFVVDKNGDIQNIELQRGISSSCDREAIKVIKNMPRWIPGKQNGETVQVYFTLPVFFRIGNR